MTTGTDIVGALLRADPELLAMIPAKLIKAGTLPEKIALPALLLRTVSSVERAVLVRGAVTRTIDRVAVTVRAADYRGQVNVIKLVKGICAGKTGDIGGGTRVAILHAGVGPDIEGPGNSFEQTIDFRVSYDA